MGEKRKIQLPIGIPQPNFWLPCGFWASGYMLVGESCVLYKVQPCYFLKEVIFRQFNSIFWSSYKTLTLIVSPVKTPLRYLWINEVFPTLVSPRMITFKSLSKVTPKKSNFMEISQFKEVNPLLQFVFLQLYFLQLSFH